MCEIDEKEWIFYVIAAVGFCNFILHSLYLSPEFGFVLVVDDDSQIRVLERILVEKMEAKRVKHWNSRTDLPKNYELGVHTYQKYDKEEDILDFLETDIFFPIVIVSGVVPEFLFLRSYIFRCNANEKILKDFHSLYCRMKNCIKDNIEPMVYELSNINSSKNMANFEVEEKNMQCFRALLASGKIWGILFREENNEKATEEWMSRFCEYAVSALEAMDDLCGLCNIAEVVRQQVLQYVLNNPVEMCERVHYEGDCAGDMILVDEDFYYFPESLFKKICAAFEKSVSFLQIKNELYEEKILICNRCKNSNFTVKVGFYDKENEKFVRKRFLKFKKAELYADDGLSLEDVIYLKTSEKGDEK